MSRMLGFSAALAEWQWYRGGDQKSRSRRRQRARERAVFSARKRSVEYGPETLTPRWTDQHNPP